MIIIFCNQWWIERDERPGYLLELPPSLPQSLQDFLHFDCTYCISQYPWDAQLTQRWLSSTQFPVKREDKKSLTKLGFTCNLVCSAALRIYTDDKNYGLVQNLELYFLNPFKSNEFMVVKCRVIPLLWRMHDKSIRICNRTLNEK